MAQIDKKKIELPHDFVTHLVNKYIYVTYTLQCSNQIGQYAIEMPPIGR